MERGAWRREPGGVRVVRRAPDHLRPDPGVNHPATNTSAPVSPTPHHSFTVYNCRVTRCKSSSSTFPLVNNSRHVFISYLTYIAGQLVANNIQKKPTLYGNSFIGRVFCVHIQPLTFYWEHDWLLPIRRGISCRF